MLWNKMTLKIYNSLSREKEVFTPINDDKVTMYVCGMTVYSDAHIGHARTYFAFDVIRRYLEFKGYAVLYVQNVPMLKIRLLLQLTKKMRMLWIFPVLLRIGVWEIWIY